MLELWGGDGGQMGLGLASLVAVGTVGAIALQGLGSIGGLIGGFVLHLHLLAAIALPMAPNPEPLLLAPSFAASPPLLAVLPFADPLGGSGERLGPTLEREMTQGDAGMVAEVAGEDGPGESNGPGEADGPGELEGTVVAPLEQTPEDLRERAPEPLDPEQRAPAPEPEPALAEPSSPLEPVPPPSSQRWTLENLPIPFPDRQWRDRLRFDRLGSWHLPQIQWPWRTSPEPATDRPPADPPADSSPAAPEPAQSQPPAVSSPDPSDPSSGPPPALLPPQDPQPLSWRDHVTFGDLLTRLGQETFADRSLPRFLGGGSGDRSPGDRGAGDSQTGNLHVDKAPITETNGDDAPIGAAPIGHAQTDEATTGNPNRDGSDRQASLTGEAIPAVPRLQEVPPPVQVQQLQAYYDRFMPQVQILQPQANAILATPTVTVQLAVQGYDLFQDPELGLGPHLAWVLDDRPAQALYDLSQPLELTDLTPGSHTLRVLAVRPWGESYQNWGALAQVTFHLYAPTPQGVPRADRPLLTPHLPQGVYGAEPILLDFGLSQAPLRVLAQADDPASTWELRCVLNGEAFTLPAWESIYLEGVREGSNWLQLLLVDGQGNPWQNGGLNAAVQGFEYRPGGEDGRSRLMRGELSAQELEFLRHPRPQPEATDSPGE